MRNIFYYIFALYLVSSLFCLEARGEPLLLLKPAAFKKVYLGKTFVLKTSHPVKRVSIGDGSIALVRAISPNEILIKGMHLGFTNLLLWYDGKEDPYLCELKVEIDPSQIEEAEKLVKKLVPDSNVKIIPAGSELLLEGTVTSQEDMQKVLQIVSAYFKKNDEKEKPQKDKGESSTTINISTGTGLYEGEGTEQLYQNLNVNVAIKNNLIVLKGYQQVQLDVKIAEVSRSGMKKMGLNFLDTSRWWTVGLSKAGIMQGEVSGSRTYSNGSSMLSSTLESTAEMSSPFGDALNILVHSLKRNSLAILSILKGQGLARLLASPSLVTMSGQEANFTVGGEIPVPVTNENGNISVEYKKYGIILKFTPYVVGKEAITLNVESEVSGPDWGLGTSSGGVAVPGLTTRKVETTLQLKDGQTFVMAGLLKERSNLMTSKIPFLGDIPLLGSLFTHKNFLREETELVVIVTPHLVRPLNKNELKGLPGDKLSGDISDIKFFILNYMGLKDKKYLTRVPEYMGKIGFSE